MKYFLIALTLLVSCKPGRERIVDKPEALVIVKSKLSPIVGLEPIDCPPPEPRTPYYVCYGVKPDNDMTVQQIDEALQTSFVLPFQWKFEYSASAKYYDSQEKILLGIVYVTLSKALGNEDRAPGYKKVLEVFIEDNPYR